MDIAENKADTVPSLGELAEMKKMQWGQSVRVANLPWETWKLHIGGNM